MINAEPADRESRCRAAETALAQGFAAVAAGRNGEAEAWFRQALTLTPESADAWGALGDVLAATDRRTEAIPPLRHAVTLESAQPFRLAALADALINEGCVSEAAAVCRQWLALRPDSAPALRQLGHALVRLGDRPGAIPSLSEALLLAPDDPDTAAVLGELLIEQAESLAALERLQPVARRHPDYAPLQFQLGRAWLALGETGKAAAAWQQGLTGEPDHPGITAALQNLGDGAVRATASPPDPAYVRALFDRYAERFDAELLGPLKYRAPTVLREAVDRQPPGSASGRGWDILDLGCGTGLAGVAFAPLARTLAGVDLSPRMVDQARRRGVYQELTTGDLLDRLHQEAERWDLILAADVLNYLGDLGPVLEAAARALRANGRLAATVERAADPDRLTVTPSRRVQHGARHVAARAAAAGLAVISLEEAVLRTEGRQPVIGIVFVLARP